MTKNFLNVMNNSNLMLARRSKTPRRINSRRSISRVIVIKVRKIKDR
jgi:hypothetical protein